MKNYILRSAFILLLIIEFYPIETYSQDSNSNMPAKLTSSEQHIMKNEYYKTDPEIIEKLKEFKTIPEFKINNSYKISIIINNGINTNEKDSNSKDQFNEPDTEYSRLIKEMLDGKLFLLPISDN